MGVDPPSRSYAQYSLVAVMAMLSEARKWKKEHAGLEASKHAEMYKTLEIRGLKWAKDENDEVEIIDRIKCLRIGNLRLTP